MQRDLLLGVRRTRRLDAEILDAMSVDAFAPADSRAIRVVIADDHLLLRDLLKRVLAKVCRRSIEFVGEAVDGAEAVALVERLLPDVVIMDVNMPLMDGIEATRAIGQRFASVAVIGWSALDDDVTRDAMLAAGAKHVFAKSGDFAGLAEAVCRSCDRADPDSASGVA